MLNKILLFFSLLLVSLPVLAAENAVQRENARATLVSEQDAISPGQLLHVGVLIEPRPGWHTYWENPGDAGLATTLAWTLPEGFAASSIDWPPPERIMEDILAVYGYSETVLLPVSIVVPEKLGAAAYPIKVKADWLICEKICVPESAELEIRLPVGDAPAPSSAAHLFEQHRRQQPVMLPEPVAYNDGEKHFTLHIPIEALGVEIIREALFLARQPRLVEYAGTQEFSVEDDTLLLTVPKSGAMPEGTLSGLVSLTGDGEKKYFDVTLSNSSPHRGEVGRGASTGDAKSISQASPHPNPLPEGEGIFILLAFALLGGLILNLMPCVLPVLSLKALALVNKAAHTREQIMALGVAYTLGIMVSFAVIAGILIGLQQAGAAVGWGYQMQSPAFVGFLVYLLFLVGLNLSGVFEMPVLFGNVGGNISDQSSARGSFFTGILAAAVATPCTAPFMASAVGAALTLPAWQAMLVFEALGLGLALPFLLISLFPALIRFLPRPGAWMETFRQFLAFPMYASVIWLLWVLTLQTGVGGMALALMGMLAIVIVIWMRRLFKEGKHYHLAAAVGLVLVLALSLPALSRMEKEGAMMPDESLSEEIDMLDFSADSLQELRQAGTPVFVDATAAWCITCQVNARIAIHTERTLQAFAERGVVLMVADWTLRDAEIGRFLQDFGYRGVPLYVYYPPHGEPVVLPQLLTEDIVIETISK